jgi:predicted GNAT family acetyltransferase
MTPRIEHNPARQCFQTTIAGRLAILTYQKTGEKMVIDHTQVPPEFRGQGIASALAHAALDYAAQNQLRVVPLCSFVAALIQRHPQYQRLLA